MSKKGSEKTPKTNCCDQRECCPSSEDSTKQQPPNKKQWWKVAVFALGMLMVVGAITYSLVTRHTSASVPLDNSSVPQIASTTCANAASTLGIGDLVWVKELSTIFTDHNLIFVVLPGNDTNLNNTLANRISAATAQIEARNTSVGTFTLSASDPEFSVTTGRLAITELPAVLALSTSGNGAIITGDITEGKLLQTYVVVNQPVCVPGSSSGCCGSK